VGLLPRSRIGVGVASAQHGYRQGSTAPEVLISRATVDADQVTAFGRDLAWFASAGASPCQARAKNRALAVPRRVRHFYDAAVYAGSTRPARRRSAGIAPWSRPTRRTRTRRSTCRRRCRLARRRDARVRRSRPARWRGASPGGASRWTMMLMPVPRACARAGADGGGAQCRRRGGDVAVARLLS
jgi:hypothetical protein